MKKSWQKILKGGVIIKLWVVDIEMTELHLKHRSKHTNVNLMDCPSFHHGKIFEVTVQPPEMITKFPTKNVHHCNLQSVVALLQRTLVGVVDF